MQATKFNEATNLLTAPEGWDVETQGECGDLYVRIDEQGITSVWIPSEEELACLVAGGGVILTVAARAMPPVLLMVAPIDYEEQSSYETTVIDLDEVVDLPNHGAEPVEEGEQHDDIQAEAGGTAGNDKPPVVN